MPLKARGGRCINVEFVSNVDGVNSKKVIQCNIRDITQRKTPSSKKNDCDGGRRWKRLASLPEAWPTTSITFSESFSDIARFWKSGWTKPDQATR